MAVAHSCGPAEQWDSRKDAIYDLYMKQNLPLETVQSKLARQFFNARSRSACEGAEKARPTIVETKVGARRVTSLGRQGFSQLTSILGESPCTPEEVRIHKVFLSEAIISSRGLSFPALSLPGLRVIEEALKLTGLFSNQDRRSGDASSTVDVATWRKESFSGIPSLITLETPGLTVSSDGSEEIGIFSRGAESSILANRWTSNQDTRQNFLEPSPSNSSLDIMPVPAANGLPPSAIVKLLGLATKSHVAAYFSKQNPDIVVEDIESRLCAPKLVVDRVLISYVIYLMCNNLLDRTTIEACMKSLLARQLESVLDWLSHPKSTYIGCFEQQILLHAARHGRVDLLNMLHIRQIDLSIAINDGWHPTTPLREAIVHDQYAFAERLIELGVDVDVDVFVETDLAFLRPYNPLATAYQLLPTVFTRIYESTMASDFEGSLPMAVRAGLNDDGILKLLRQGSDINAVDQRAWTALHYAIEKEDIALIEVLLQEGACCNGPSRHDPMERFPILIQEPEHEWLGLHSRFWTPLALAVSLENHKICEILLEAGAEVNPSLHERLLHSSERAVLPSSRSWLEMILIDGLIHIRGPQEVFNTVKMMCMESVEDDGFNGAEIEDCTTLPLVLAVCRGQVEIIQLLLRAGANPNERDGLLIQTNALEAAAICGDIDIISLLIQVDAEINIPAAAFHGRTALQYAAKGGHYNAVKYLLEHGADIDAPCADDQGLTALQAAVFSGDEELVDLMLSWDAEVNAPPALKGGYTALSAAIEQNSRTIFWSLIKAGANTDISNWNGCDDDNIEFLVASRRGFDHFTGLLIDLGLDIDVRLESGHTLRERALVEAVKNSAHSISYELLDKAVNLDINLLTEALGWLWTSKKEGQKVAEALIDCGADVTTSAILAKACLSGDQDFVENIVARGAQINAPPRTSSGTTALGVACIMGYSTIVDFLLSQGANVNARVKQDGTTALQAAAHNTHMRVAQILIASGAIVNAPPARCRGRSALQAVCEEGSITLLELLLEHGADVNAPACPEHGVTALQAAAIGGYIRIAQVLIAAGADIGAPGSRYNGRTAINGAAEHGRLDMVKFLLDNYRLKEGESLSRLCKEAVEYAEKECHWAVVTCSKTINESQIRSLDISLTGRLSCSNYW
ncbi:hypothetical protein LTS07_009962 [Exophiala sideris]|uniref:Clr5 domain-containing protein n=1 Tax=Exophiala sideris TaxID=1016849 RepID=A0ABR0IY83_9EURO|nr:hypothetical protein LTS07_009962 [Exophiala sideris]KAK5028044.1 hypothetical protein LTR13_009273 [Exophiala sideris]KAK5051785.1 hypothetical protein LTR69_010076 [Exophiala sideris]